MREINTERNSEGEVDTERKTKERERWTQTEGLRETKIERDGHEKKDRYIYRERQKERDRER